MPAPTGPLIGLALGALFAWAASENPNRSKNAVVLTPLSLVALFSLVVFTPAAAYFIVFEPDWAYAYLLDSSGRVGALHAFLLLCDVASVPLGFFLALRGSSRPSFSSILRWVGAPVALSAAFIAILLPRLSVQATYAQFHGDFGTRAVAGGPLGYALIWTCLVVASAALWTAYALRRLQ
ncbi:MAG TPA: hypothetical protein VER33_17920 [Polyangiaceae bacterium]|nr:hypothetical protein [Polyangiaceae bacterium]